MTGRDKPLPVATPYGSTLRWILAIPQAAVGALALWLGATFVVMGGGPRHYLPVGSLLLANAFGVVAIRPWAIATTLFVGASLTYFYLGAVLTPTTPGPAIQFSLGIVGEFILVATTIVPLVSAGILIYAFRNHRARFNVSGMRFRWREIVFVLGLVGMACILEYIPRLFRGD